MAVVGDVRPDWSGTFAPLEWAAPVAVRRPHRKLLTALTVLSVLLVIVGACGLGYLAWHNRQVANHWEHVEQAKAAQAAQLTTQLGVANTHIKSLNGQLDTLNGQVTSLQGQLADVANQKEKAVDQATVLQQLLTDGGQVADSLQTCISATNQFASDVANLLTGQPAPTLSGLQTEAQHVDNTCNAAESANQRFQDAIKSLP